MTSSECGQAVVLMSKYAGAPKATMALSGRLYVSKSGWLLLSVPNALVRGAFSALDVSGAELPVYAEGDPLNAHISVMTDEEVTALGGPEKISERGKTFTYTLGGVYTVNPESSDTRKVWYIKAESPELERLRRTYGLSAKPHNGEYEFHITFARRRKGVFGDNSVSKAASVEVTQSPLYYRKYDSAGLMARSIQPYPTMSRINNILLNEAKVAAAAGRPGEYTVKEATSVAFSDIRINPTRNLEVDNYLMSWLLGFMSPTKKQPVKEEHRRVLHH